MNYNLNQEQRVWERVMGTPRQEQTLPQTQPQTGRLCAENVKAMAEKEQESACLYRSLAQRVCPNCRHILLQIAQEESCHARHLAAVYFVLTGQKLCLAQPQKPCITCPAWDG